MLFSILIISVFINFSFADVEVLGEGFPPEIIDDEPEETGYEVVIQGRQDY